jgi:serine/threonine protein kinase
MAAGVAKRPGMYEEAFPPECYGGTGTVHSDIYQVGLLLYRVVNGELFYGDQRGLPSLTLQTRICEGKFPDRKKFLPHVPNRMKAVIRKALAIDPIERYTSAPEFADDLGRVVPT